MDKCIFCKVVKGEIPSYTLYQDDMATAFLDINPVTTGHILVIPNKHFRRIDSIKDENVMKGLMNAIIEMANLLVKSGICRDYTVLQDNGINAQQDIMHTHFHIIPRHHNEKVQFHLPTNEKESSENSLNHTYNRLKATKSNY